MTGSKTATNINRPQKFPTLHSLSVWQLAQCPCNVTYLIQWTILTKIVHNLCFSFSCCDWRMASITPAVQIKFISISFHNVKRIRWSFAFSWKVILSSAFHLLNTGEFYCLVPKMIAHLIEKKGAKYKILPFSKMPSHEWVTSTPQPSPKLFLNQPLVIVGLFDGKKGPSPFWKYFALSLTISTGRAPHKVAFPVSASNVKSTSC